MIDPTIQNNTPEFWTGYGYYRQGIYYDAIPQTPDHIAGWCYGLSEGKEAPKPLWESKIFYEGIAVIILSIWGSMNAEVIVNNPQSVAAIGVVIGALQVYLRKITGAKIK